jgi:glycosyltransferase involved in cell wall biosynthesis
MADGERVRFYFNADEAHKIELIQNAKAVIYPVQFDEAHNLVAIESAACHTPFITYRRGGLQQMPTLAHIVDTPEQFKEAMQTVDKWFVPTEEDWTVEGRLPTYLSFFEKIIGGERW